MHKGDELPYHMFRLVEGVRRRLVRELQARLEPPYPRGSHMRLLGMIPVDGMRITDLAALSAMTKQSLGELVTAMEAHGLVESRRLDTDRRVRLVVPTKAGLATAATMAGHLAAIEDQWRNEVGARRYDSMKAVLDELGRDEFG
ncbi:MarR family winged helix-turn-helix transcriptional regulator [Gordonia sp. (in: high G+C Gram-positive bacteria)]|jgi:DNA-binding MarR family transcriptional regulator|uniref:MarR family winged helix-turn-helix transcriptional regulator n=1 Tax=Gordonia sp. (in: high G+C Gram-positive bacteria) TaxID=84139 RepID=UPI001D7C0D4E|nr:MarR family winged helix-turn-helix transcriptional regulator [Gordonia sp. (in: high G+C Gram-positive bacteria)]MCB1293276.1 winged helix-turn-helix transcriptional regulator [Gordonia sp. (in: high G+C Gram-positive bacteria)]HMS73839.1 MarR family winged helix-turn-helix transcriptional regulator [Gordonia sp. (in: high G+C Gram-positive bacteria)]HQV17242.1 MarR family winged helix-turn-helix transcriptional regulator [Gordonia sp. (in: high G+C Gram-positive bacteria)]